MRIPVTYSAFDEGAGFLPGTGSAITDTLRYIKTYGSAVDPRPVSERDICDGVGIDDPGLVTTDLGLLRLAWPSASAPHQFRFVCSELWSLPARRTNETLLRFRQRGWIAMWTWPGAFTYHLLPAGAALLVDEGRTAKSPVTSASQHSHR